MKQDLYESDCICQNVSTIYISTISTRHCDDERDDIKKTCICSGKTRKTWNLTSLATEMKKS
jgi:hypothetical protein